MNIDKNIWESINNGNFLIQDLNDDQKIEINLINRKFNREDFTETPAYSSIKRPK